MKTSKKVFILILAICFLGIVFGTSYALFTLNVTKNTDFKVSIGTLDLVIEDTETEDKIVLENAIPTTDSDALTSDGYTFTITNNGTLDTYYQVYLDDVDITSSYEKLDSSYIKTNLLDQSTNTSVTENLDYYTNRVITTGTLKSGEDITYTLRTWVDYDAPNTEQNKYYALQIRVVGTQVNDPENN